MYYHWKFYFSCFFYNTLLEVWVKLLHYFIPSCVRCKILSKFSPVIYKYWQFIPISKLIAHFLTPCNNHFSIQNQYSLLMLTCIICSRLTVHLMVISTYTVPPDTKYRLSVNMGTPRRALIDPTLTFLTFQLWANSL